MIIYLLYNRVSDKSYIGQTTRPITDRIRNHIISSRKGKSAIHCAIKKYGVESFDFYLLDIAKSIAELNFKERMYIYGLNTLSPHGYNLISGGGNSFMSEEVKKKISIANKNNKYYAGRKLSDATKEKMSKSQKERWRERKNNGVEKTKMKQEYKDKHSLITKEWHKLHPEWRDVLRERMVGNIYRLGVKESEETRKKRSKSAKIAWVERRQSSSV